MDCENCQEMAGQWQKLIFQLQYVCLKINATKYLGPHNETKVATSLVITSESFYIKLG
jgi:hypothetical protein